MDALTHRNIETNGIRLRVAIQGGGPLVLLCHGFPETSHSWRHQMQALAAAGYRAVAPDLRGYGESSRPASSDAPVLLWVEHTPNDAESDLPEAVREAGLEGLQEAELSVHRSATGLVVRADR